MVIWKIYFQLKKINLKYFLFPFHPKLSQGSPLMSFLSFKFVSPVSLFFYCCCYTHTYKLVCFMCISVCPAYVYVKQVCLVPKEAKRGIYIPGNYNTFNNIYFLIYKCTCMHVTTGYQISNWEAHQWKISCLLLSQWWAV